eukprot:6486943-Amphidinium_carterae.1
MPLTKACTVGGVALGRTVSQPLQCHPKRVVAAPSTLTFASQSQTKVDETVPGFTTWLTRLGLQAKFHVARRWVEEQGACSLSEIVENLDDFMDALSLDAAHRAGVRELAASTAKLADASVQAACVPVPTPRRVVRPCATSQSVPLKTATSVPVTQLEYNAAAPQKNEFRRVVSIEGGSRVAPVTSVRSTSIYRTETGASDAVPEEVPCTLAQVGAFPSVFTPRARIPCCVSSARKGKAVFTLH